MAAVATGPEFIVNAIPDGDQYRPFITSLETGGFLIGWQDESTLVSATTGSDTRFARFGALGNRLSPGTDALAYPTAPITPGVFAYTSAQFEGSAASFANGKYVIVYRDYSASGGDLNNGAIRAQIFNANGALSGDLIDVNSTFPLIQSEPSVAVLQNGRFVVTWTSALVSASGTTDIIRRLFNADGSPATGEQTVNAQITGDQNNSTVHALSTGGFAVVWDDRESGVTVGNQTKTFIRFYGANGTASGTPLLANAGSAGDPQHVGFTELTDGRILVTWTEQQTASPGDGSGASVKARIYNPATAAFGSTFAVNTTTSNDQSDSQIAALDSGQWVAVWTDNSKTGLDTSFEAVRMQVFNSAGAKVGAEILVNSEHLFEQRNPVVTVLSDYRFVVAWEDNSHSGADVDGFSIRSRIYDARIAAIDIDGDTGADEFQGSKFGDTLSGLAGNDTLHGALGDDLLFGGIGIDVLFGDDGNDKLNGDAGADTMRGGAGNDIYWVDDPGDTVIELLNEGYDTVNALINSYTLTANVERLKFLGSGNFTGTGNVLDNRIYGGIGNDRFVADTGGADQYFGGAGTDIADYRSRPNGAIINLATNTFAGAAAGDSFTDIEVFYGSSTAADTMTGGAAAASFSGSGGDDTLTGGSAGDLLRGGDNIDTLRGNDGADRIEGGRNNDTMFGGAGVDTYVFTEIAADGGFGNDVIMDFVDGQDKLSFSSAVATGMLDLGPVTGQNTTTVTISMAEGTITLKGAAPIFFNSADVIFF